MRYIKTYENIIVKDWEPLCKGCKRGDIIVFAEIEHDILEYGREFIIQDIIRGGSHEKIKKVNDISDMVAIKELDGKLITHEKNVPYYFYIYRFIPQLTWNMNKYNL